MKKQVNLNKKIFDEYVYMVVAIILIVFFTSTIDIFDADVFNLLIVLFIPVFTLIAFVINPIRILIFYKLEFKAISSKMKRIFYYVMTLLPILSTIFIMAFALISDFMYGR